MADVTLPPSAARLARDLEQATARYGDGGARADVDVLRRIGRPDACPADLLPWLAWGWRAPWIEDDTDAQRALTALALELARAAGTPGAVLDAVRVLYPAAELREWPRRHLAQLSVPAAAGAAEVQALLRLIHHTARVSVHVGVVGVGVTLAGHLRLAAGAGAAAVAEVAEARLRTAAPFGGGLYLVAGIGAAAVAEVRQS